MSRTNIRKMAITTTSASGSGRSTSIQSQGNAERLGDVGAHAPGSASPDDVRSRRWPMYDTSSHGVGGCGVGQPGRGYALVAMTSAALGSIAVTWTVTSRLGRPHSMAAIRMLVLVPRDGDQLFGSYR